METNPYFHLYEPYRIDESRAQSDAQLVIEIQKAVNGAYNAVACYAKLANLAPTKEEKTRILGILADAKNHLKIFTQLYINLSGEQPAFQLTDDCPDTYDAGIDFAFLNKQKTVDFYLSLADQIRDTSAREKVRRAAADEQHHAVWFLYFLNNLQKA